jgi:hypothetical protein
MKKTMKALAIILALALAVSAFAGCGSDEEEPLRLSRQGNGQESPGSSSGGLGSLTSRNSGPEGYYTIVSLESDGERMTEADDNLEDTFGPTYLEFKNDGNVAMVVFGDMEEGQYSVSGSTVTMTFFSAGAVLEGTIQGDNITIDYEDVLMVFERNPRYAPPADIGSGVPVPPQPPEPVPAPAAIMIGPGDIRVTAESEFLFTPPESGTWELSTLNSGGNDPYIRVYDSSGVSIGYDDDGGDGWDALLEIDLDARETYTIRVGFWSREENTSLRIVRAAPARPAIHPQGGYINVNGRTEFSFTPNQGGVWVLRTSDSNGSDPYLELYDSSGNLIAEDDDSGSGFNALINVNLNSGQTYIVHAMFWGSGGGSYNLNVS